jgi:putative hydrolase of the HAD superfamily
MLPFNNQWCIVFDLDDTLYKEVHFLESAYRLIAQTLEPELSQNIYAQLLQWRKDKISVLDKLAEQYQPSLSIAEMVELYRYHQPDIQLSQSTSHLLTVIKNIGAQTALITDGRSRSQRNKLAALGLSNYFDCIIISEELGSEKPNPANYEAVVQQLPAKHYVYVGDNTKKDFLAPNKMQWQTIGLLDDGLNIHPQNLQAEPAFLPQHFIASLSIAELEKIYENL